MRNDEKLLIWCGDSWTYGDGLDKGVKKQARFPSLIGQQLEVDTLNLAKSGSSIEHLTYKIDQILRIRKKFPEKKILALFGLTVPYRVCIQQEDSRLITVSINDFDLCGYKQWAVNIFNNKEIIKRTCLALSWISSQCEKNNINFKFYNILCNQFDFDKSKFAQYLHYDDWLINPYWSMYGEIYDVAQLNFDKVAVLENSNTGKKIKQQYMLPCKHPNLQGHEKIANKLMPEIHQIINNMNL